MPTNFKIPTIFATQSWGFRNERLCVVDSVVYVNKFGIMVIGLMGKVFYPLEWDGG